MDVKQAKAYLEDFIEYAEKDGIGVPSIEPYDLAIKALEKQQPKKIMYREQSYGTPYLCPKCEADQIKVEFFKDNGAKAKEQYSYCWCCGQKIDWSDEKK